MTGLCVIDMQPYYKASHPALQNVIREIRCAKAEGMPIILVKMLNPNKDDPDPVSRWETEIFEEIELELETYDKVMRAGKRNCDGSGAVLRALRRHGYHLANLRVCGVETDACVEATVCSLSRQMRTTIIEVIMDACNHNNKSKDRGETFKEMRDLDNVRLS